MQSLANITLAFATVDGDKAMDTDLSIVTGWLQA